MPNIEEHIRRAIQDGKFDDLPGQGKPLNLDDNPHIDPEWHLAYHMLKSSGYTLPWIEARNDIENELAHARADLSQAWKWRQSNLTDPEAESRWVRASTAFADHVEKLNRRIFEYNLQTPHVRFQMLMLDIEQELERAHRQEVKE
jgi:DnaJ homolog subfamily C member 28